MSKYSVNPGDVQSVVDAEDYTECWSALDCAKVLHETRWFRFAREVARECHVRSLVYGHENWYEADWGDTWQHLQPSERRCVVLALTQKLGFEAFVDQEDKLYISW